MIGPGRGGARCAPLAGAVHLTTAATRMNPEPTATDTEFSIPAPPDGSPMEVARRAWQVAWSASNAAANYHASVMRHMIAHEQRIADGMQRMREQLSRDFDDYKRALLEALGRVGIHVDLSDGVRVDLSPAAGAIVVGSDGIRDRVASSHELETGLAQVSDRLEEHFDERLQDLTRTMRLPGSSTPSDRVRELLGQERARIEAEQQILRLELEKKTMELAHATEVKRLTDKQSDLVASNARWLRVAFMIAGGIVTVLGALLVWALTRQPPGH